MPIKMKPTSVIVTRLGLQEGGPVHKFLTNTCYLHMDKYVPFDSGDLASTVSITTDGTAIIYHMPYAKYQYYGERRDGSHKINEANRNRSKHPDATSFWDKKMWNAEKADVISEVQDYIKTHGGK